MAYGVHLQCYYTYRSRWFWLANAVMNGSVNLTLTARPLTSAGALFLAGGGGVGMISAVAGRQAWAWPLLSAALALSLLLTLFTLAVVLRMGLPAPAALRVPAPRDLVPSLCALPLCGFWLFFDLERPPLWTVLHQRALYYGLLAVLALLSALLCPGGRRRAGLCQAGALALGGLAFPPLAVEWAYLTYNQTFIQVVSQVGEEFPRFGRFTPAQLALALAALCLLPALIGPERKLPAGGEE